MGEGDSEDTSYDITGTTLRVYWFLLQKGKKYSLREVQRECGLSSPSLALYHLDKLKESGLVNSDIGGGYYVQKDVRVGFMNFFFGRKGKMIPRYFIYAIFFLSELIGYLAFFGLSIRPESILLLFTIVIAILFSLYEGLVLLKKSPILE